jgi:hypothetical protein
MRPFPLRVLLSSGLAAASVFACTKLGDGTGPGTGHIQGVVRDTALNLMDQVSIRLREPGSTSDALTALTDASGAYRFADLPQGNFDVFIVAPEATVVSGPNPRTVTVTKGNTTLADFSLTLVPVSFSTHVQPVFNAACIGCHFGAAPPMGLKLTSDSSHFYTVGHASTQVAGMPRVLAFMPDSSYLVHKIQGTHQNVGGSGSQMPAGAPPLANRRIQMMRRWILEGALKN